MRLFDTDTWGEAFHSLRTNRKRTLATAFGVFWGILMLVVLMSISQGFSNALNRQLNGVASNCMVLYPQSTSRPYKGFPKDRYWRLQTDDIEPLKNRFPRIGKISCVLNGQYNTPILYGSKKITAPLYAADEDFDEVIYSDLIAGRRLNKSDEVSRRRYCTIGTAVATKLFGSAEGAIGKVINVDGSFFTVVGVSTQRSSNISFNGREENKVRIPVVLLRNHLGAGDEIDGIVYSLRGSGKENKAVNEQIKRYLLVTHDVHPEDSAALFIWDFSDMFQFARMLLLGMKIFIWFIGIGTILSGIIGISNIMLVSLKERTREIGIRRAIGAAPRDIALLILLESSIISLLSGLTGLLLGVGQMALVSSFLPGDFNQFLIDPLIPFWTAVGALILTICGGICGGLLPLRRALQINAIDAIRDE